MIRSISFIGVIISGLLLSCSPRTSERILITVTKIDSVGNYYVIYGTHDSKIYKLLSKRVSEFAGTPVEVDSRYKFSIKSAVFTGKIGSTVISPTTNDLVKCVRFDSVSLICKEKGCVWDLFYSDNLRGRNFVKR